MLEAHTAHSVPSVTPVKESEQEEPGKVKKKAKKPGSKKRKRKNVEREQKQKSEGPRGKGTPDTKEALEEIPGADIAAKMLRDRKTALEIPLENQEGRDARKEKERKGSAKKKKRKKKKRRKEHTASAEEIEDKTIGSEEIMEAIIVEEADEQDESISRNGTGTKKGQEQEGEIKRSRKSNKR